MADKIKPIFTWRSAICGSDLAATTRHVALTLSLHMSELGDSCHPGPTLLAQETGLSVRAVKEHLGVLERSGWIVCVERGGRKGERRRANDYTAAIPQRLPFEPVHERTGADAAPVQETRTTRADERAVPVQELHPALSVSTPRSSLVPDNEPKTAKRGTQIPDGFAVDDVLRAWAAKECPSVDIDRETDQWRDYHRAKGSVMKDWRSAWRTWMRNAVKFDRRPGPTKRAGPDRSGVEAFVRRVQASGGVR